MGDWLILLAGAVIAGGAVAYVMVVPHRWLPLPTLLVPCAVALALRGLHAVLTTGSASMVGMAVLLSAVGLSAGYWLAAASMLCFAGRHSTSRETHESNTATGTAIVLFSCAAPSRYQVGPTATHIRRLIESDALRLPTSALPFVFLAERSRYRAIGGYLPARTSVVAVAEQMEVLLSDSTPGPILIAWSEGSPSLPESVNATLVQNIDTIVVVTLGPDGSYVPTEARLDLESDSTIGPTRAPVVFAPSIWHSEELASRLVARILEPTVGARPDEVGVVLVGAGQPTAWESLDEGWRERENYFNQRVRLLLTEKSIREEHVRTAWLEWQTPDVTEAVRHLAALGCTRVIVAPSTIPCATLSTALDLEHMVASARVAETVRTVTLPPWGDDPALAQAAASAVRRATAHH